MTSPPQKNSAPSLADLWGEISEGVAWGQPINRLGLASLVCGSLALLAASMPYLKLFALLLSIAGLGLGLTGIVAMIRSSTKNTKEHEENIFRVTSCPSWIMAALRMTIPAAGAMVSLPALYLAGFGLFWGQTGKSPDHQQQLIPLGGQMSSSAAANRGSEWVDAGRNAVQQDDVRVRLVSAAIGPVEVKDRSGKTRVTEKCLIIKLRISNAGAARLIQYSGWDDTSSADAAHPLVYDPAGKTYGEKIFEPGQEPLGHVARAAIPPGKWVDDILIFEPVPPRVEFIRLELPWKALGMEGKLRLQIPGRMIATKAGKKPGS